MVGRWNFLWKGSFFFGFWGHGDFRGGSIDLFWSLVQMNGEVQLWFATTTENSYTPACRFVEVFQTWLTIYKVKEYVKHKLHIRQFLLFKSFHCCFNNQTNTGSLHGHTSTSGRHASVTGSRNVMEGSAAQLKEQGNQEVKAKNFRLGIVEPLAWRCAQGTGHTTPRKMNLSMSTPKKGVKGWSSTTPLFFREDSVRFRGSRFSLPFLFIIYAVLWREPFFHEVYWFSRV